MKAVIATGGKQYLVTEKDLLKVEKLDAKEGEKLTISEVLLTADDKGANVAVGMPHVDGASVEVEVKRHGREKKVIIGKHKPKKRYHKRQGHRQHFTEIQINKITTK